VAFRNLLQARKYSAVKYMPSRHREKLAIKQESFTWYKWWQYTEKQFLQVEAIKMHTGSSSKHRINTGDVCMV